MTTTSAAVVDVTTNTFERDVLDRSREVPVLVDFWATWCGPCRTLSPVLERLARDAQGAWILAKVDIDKSPDLASAFGVASVPMVMLIQDGRAVDGFVGAQPEAHIQKFLEQHVSGASAGDAVAEALAKEKAGDSAAAIAHLRVETKRNPKSGAARAHLARLLLLNGMVDEGRTLYEALSLQERESEPGRAAGLLLETRAAQPDLAGLRAKIAQDPDDLEARLALGRALLASGQPEQGIAELYEAAQRDVRFHDSAPRDALQEAFQMLGESHPLTTEYRRKLSVLLCG